MELRSEISDIVKKINEKLTIHDLRIVPGVTHTNVVFDMVVPFELDKEKNELRRLVSDEVRKNHPDHVCVITLDVEYSSYEPH